jgi:hypothetical protein
MHIPASPTLYAIIINTKAKHASNKLLVYEIRFANAVLRLPEYFWAKANALQPVKT